MIRGLSTRYRGFTLLELLVVSGITTVAICIFVPFLLQMREDARSTSCIDRLRRLGSAIRQFEVARGGLPPGGLLSPAQWSPRCDCEFGIEVSECFDFRGDRGGSTVSWIVLILPYLDAQGLFDRFDLNQSIYTLPGDPQRQILRQLVCPSNGVGGPEYNGAGVPQATGKFFAKGNFAAWVSPVHMNFQRVYRAALGGFEPGERVGQSLARITDGLANSILVTELRTLDRPWDSRGVWTLPYPGASLLALDLHPQGNCPSTTYVPDPFSLPGHAYLPNSLNRDQLVACHQPIYAVQQGMPCALMAWLAAAPRSNHPGGVNSVFLDGHARFISNDIDHLTMAYYVCVHDGQLIEKETHRSRAKEALSHDAR